MCVLLVRPRLQSLPQPFLALEDKSGFTTEFPLENVENGRVSASLSVCLHQCAAVIWCAQVSSTTLVNTSARRTTSVCTGHSATAAGSTSAGRWCLRWGGRTTHNASCAASAGSAATSGVTATSTCFYGRNHATNMTQQIWSIFKIKQGMPPAIVVQSRTPQAMY